VTARSHHYVPQWLQRRFLEGESRLFYRDLAPDVVEHPRGSSHVRRATLRWGPEKCFAATDLYAVNLPGHQADVVERQFFGQIDANASRAIKYFADGGYAPQNVYYEWFLHYLSVQKMRTPKGLDWLRSFGDYPFGPRLTREALMSTLASIGDMHITTWAESVWEVVDAPLPEVGFILTDHPVTAFNLKAYPTSKLTRYPLDPVIEMLGTRTLFPLSAGRCLILSNHEFVENPSPTSALKPRTNPRSFGFTFFSPMHIARGRGLTAEETWYINFILKRRARRYVAAPVRDWLTPEEHIRSQDWAHLDSILQPPKPELLQEIWAEFEDGTKVAIDRLGRPITDPAKIERMERFDREVLKRK
jgi:Protein of unknown function (DUF4238)